MPTHMGVLVNTTDEVAITTFFARASEQKTMRRKIGITDKAGLTFVIWSSPLLRRLMSIKFDDLLIHGSTLPVFHEVLVERVGADDFQLPHLPDTICTHMRPCE